MEISERYPRVLTIRRLSPEWVLLATAAKKLTASARKETPHRTRVHASEKDNWYDRTRGAFVQMRQRNYQGQHMSVDSLLRRAVNVAAA